MLWWYIYRMLRTLVGGNYLKLPQIQGIREDLYLKWVLNWVLENGGALQLGGEILENTPGIETSIRRQQNLKNALDWEASKRSMAEAHKEHMQKISLFLLEVVKGIPEFNTMIH